MSYCLFFYSLTGDRKGGAECSETPPYASCFKSTVASLFHHKFRFHSSRGIWHVTFSWVNFPSPTWSTSFKCWQATCYLLVLFFESQLHIPRAILRMWLLILAGSYWFYCINCSVLKVSCLCFGWLFPTFLPLVDVSIEWWCA